MTQVWASRSWLWARHPLRRRLRERRSQGGSLAGSPEDAEDLRRSGAGAPEPALMRRGHVSSVCTCHALELGSSSIPSGNGNPMAGQTAPQQLQAAAGAEGDPVIQHDAEYRSLSLALIGRRREALLELRDEQRIDDIVLRRVQARLDQEELRFLRPNPLE